MINMKQYIESILNEKIVSAKFSGGGHGSFTEIIQTETGRKFFLKSGDPGKSYQCEANGLKELDKARSLRTPRIFAVSDDFLLTEYITGDRNISIDFFRDFGKKLALMHRFTADKFGFFEDNFIGANPQSNLPEPEESNDWSAFYFNKRLLFQYRLAEKNGLASPALRRYFTEAEPGIRKILNDVSEPPSLQHGDLWSGNYICDRDGNPVLIDPAVYYGHRETDIAMTKLFGGFSPDFYKAYQEEYPFSPGSQYREDIYKLYHILNHLNLFGTSYLSQAEYILMKYTKK